LREKYVVADNREVRTNNRIRARDVRLIDHKGVQIGIVSLSQALEMADNVGLDLVEVAGQARPPVCRIMDFGKFKYQRKKRQAEAKKRQVTIQLKEVKIRYKTDDHDLETKMRRATEFLNEGHKVKFMMFFKGREIQFTALGQQTMEKIGAKLMDVAVQERPPRMEGRVLTMYLASKGGKKEEGESAENKD